MDFLPLSLAWSYLKFPQKDSNIAVMLRICFWGIFIGTGALTLTLGITQGFEEEIHNKLRGINSSAVVYAPGKKIDGDGIEKALHSRFPEIVADTAKSSLHQAILCDDDTHSILFVRGIDPEAEEKINSLSSKITDASGTNPFGTNPFGTDSSGTDSSKEKKDLTALLKGNNVILGHKIADSHELEVGDEFELFVPRESGKKIALEKKEAKVSGIFDIGLDEFDRNVAFCSLELFNEFFEQEDGVDTVAVNFKENLPPPEITKIKFADQLIHLLREKIPFINYDPELEAAKKINNQLPGLTVSTWKQLYPALVASLKLEKYAMFFVIALIVLVASMNMLSLLFMQIQQKRRDIAILRAMGASTPQTMITFLLLGLALCLIGSGLGILIGALIGFVIDHYKLITLPDVYFVEHLPVAINPTVLIVVFVASMLLGLIAVWLPIRKMKNINITQVLRQE